VAPQSVWGFTAPWDTRSDSSVRANAARFEGGDAVVSGWIQLDSITGQPSRLYSDGTSNSLPASHRFALVTSWEGQRFHPEMVRRLAADSQALAASAARLARLVADGGYDGVVLDLEGHARADTALIVRVIDAFASSVRSGGSALVAAALPAGDTAAYPTRLFLPAVDLLVIMLYDEHWATSPPGPVASPLWVRRVLAQRVADVGARRIVAAFPVYGYRWRNGEPAQTLSYADAQRAASEAGVELTRDPVSLSLHAIQPGAWELWMSDAELVRALVGEATALGVSRIALWRLGLEDPAVWRVLGR
jgi:spore germination protein YaaH